MKVNIPSERTPPNQEGKRDYNSVFKLLSFQVYENITEQTGTAVRQDINKEIHSRKLYVIILFLLCNAKPSSSGRRGLWSHRPNPYGARSVIPNQAGTCPAKSVFTLVPVNARPPLSAVPSFLSSSPKKCLFHHRYV